MKQTTKKALQDHNEAMVRFLKRLIRHSDRVYGGRRSTQAEKNYQVAVKLVARAEQRSVVD